MIKSSVVVLTSMNSMDLFLLDIKHYGLLREYTLECKQSLAEARKRNTDFLESFVEEKAIPWQFALDDVRYTMTCAMDTSLMTIFLLWHRKVLPTIAIRRHPRPLADILKHVKDGKHALARKLLIDMNTDNLNLFGNATKGDNPFNCKGSLCAATYRCGLLRFDQKEVTYECSKCNDPAKIANQRKRHKVSTSVHSNISHPQQDILKKKGYDGEITVPCPMMQSLPIHLDDESHVDMAGTGDQSIACNNPREREINVTSAPWILCFVCDIEDNTRAVKIDTTGVKSLSSLQRFVTFGGYLYSLAAVLFADGGHFCSIVVDPNPNGDLNIFYDGIKRQGRHTCFGPRKGS